MRIAIDDVPVFMTPDSLTWENPPEVGTDGNGAPIYGPYWNCRLGFSRLTVVQYQTWYNAVDGDTHTVTLPRPYDGAITSYTCYIHMISPRMNVKPKDSAAVSGCDILLTRIEVT